MAAAVEATAVMLADQRHVCDELHRLNKQAAILEKADTVFARAYCVAGSVSRHVGYLPHPKCSSAPCT